MSTSVSIQETTVRRCLFCGSTGPMTREHVIPRWMSRVYHDDSGPRSYFTMHHPQERTSRDVDYIVKDVCARCNNTWLADLEARAQTLLADRIRGYPARFTAEDKIAVAAWAAKTAMLTVRVSREHEDTVPLEHYRRFGDSRLPLPEHMVWLAAYEPQARENTCHVHALETDTGGRAYYFTMQAGCVVLHVFGHDMSEPQQVNPPGGGPYTWKLWPPRPGDVSWPPPMAFDSDTLYEVLRLRITAHHG